MSAATATAETTTGRPPRPTRSPGEWARDNLFGTWYDTVTTVVASLVLGYAIFRALRFVFVTGRWAVIEQNLVNVMVWLWPFRPDLVRPWVALYLLVATIGFLLGRALRGRALAEAEDPASLRLPGWREDLTALGRRLWPFLLLLVVLGALSGAPTVWGLELLVVVDLLAFRWLGARLPDRWAGWTPALAGTGLLAAYGTLSWFGGAGFDQWGGLMLTVFLTTGGIVISFPFGVMLALGRRSSFPVVRAFSVAYIELIRGVPLITLLFMSLFMLGLFLPQNLGSLGGVTRALTALVLFTAAYIAEIVRGGLQSVPQGQIEAAQALGLSPIKQTRLIVLPQALRNVIPATVGQFISLLKDTSLVALIGQIELFGAAQRITSQGEFVGQGLLAETLIFVSFVYWVFCYTMSRESQLLEQRLGVGER